MRGGIISSSCNNLQNYYDFTSSCSVSLESKRLGACNFSLIRSILKRISDKTTYIDN